MIKIVTHSGGFHSDDVFAVAALQLLLKDETNEVVRSRDEAVIASGDYVVDVGGVYDAALRRFDHHQPGAPVRDNGIPYAAFGLVWQAYGATVCGSEAVAASLEAGLVQPVDAGDTGVNLYTLKEPHVPPFELFQIVSSYAPVWGSGGDKDAAFIEAVEFAKGLLLRQIAHHKARVTMEEIISHTYEASESKRLLIFDVPVSAVAAVQYPEVELVICPNDDEKDTTWKVNTVRKTLDSFEARVLFPESWRGLEGEALQTVSGIPDAVFCHKAGFLCVTGSKDSALQAASFAT